MVVYNTEQCAVVSCVTYYILFVDTVSLMMCWMCKRREYAFKVLVTVSVLFEIVSFALLITQH